MKAASDQNHILVVDDEPKFRWISMAKLMLQSSVSLQPSSALKVGLYRYMYRSTVPDKSAVAMPLRACGVVAIDPCQKRTILHKSPYSQSFAAIVCNQQ
jgi:hypothetical protein